MASKQTSESPSLSPVPVRVPHCRRRWSAETAPSGRDWPYVVRLSNEEQRARLAKLEAAMCGKLGAAVPRTTVLEAVLARGLDAVELEYGIKPAKR